MKCNQIIWIAENPIGDIARHCDLRRIGAPLGGGENSVRPFMPTRTTDVARRHTERKHAGRSQSNSR
jgi:hypothetical protein